jgi:hypothetical protein
VSSSYLWSWIDEDRLTENGEDLLLCGRGLQPAGFAPRRNSLKNATSTGSTIDAAIYAFITAATFVWLWPK